mmetsp:Transcript_63248/g.173856  ORF Transcript_63248/g.173856 Transcript_63248/m.173856 type:complete len:291 (-) Transcript_63248:463-1335(-)
MLNTRAAPARYGAPQHVQPSSQCRVKTWEESKGEISGVGADAASDAAVRRELEVRICREAAKAFPTWLGWPSSSGMMVVCVDRKDGTRSLVLSPVPIAALIFYFVHEDLPNGDMPETFGIGCVLLLVSMVASLLLVYLNISIVTFAKVVKIVPKQGSKSSMLWELRLVGGLLKGWPREGEPAAVAFSASVSPGVDAGPHDDTLHIALTTQLLRYRTPLAALWDGGGGGAGGGGSSDRGGSGGKGSGAGSDVLGTLSTLRRRLLSVELVSFLPFKMQMWRFHYFWAKSTGI